MHSTKNREANKHMTNPLKIGVVGGGIRGTMYAQAIREHPSAELVAFCEPSPSRAEALKTDYDVPVFPALSALLESADTLDAVIIATPDHLHLDAGLAALDAGLHVLFEKPLATTLDDSSALLAHAVNGGKHTVGFENRWHPKFQTVKALLGEAGAPMVAQRAMLQDTDFVPRTMLPWAGQSTPGWFLMPHSLDMAMWLSDTTPVEVFARGVRKILEPDGIDTFDRITASFRMSDDSIVTLDSGWVLPAARPAVFEFRFEVETRDDHFEVEIDRSGITRFTADAANYVGLAGRDHRGRLQGSPIEMTKDFIDWCLGADLSMPSLEHGHLVTKAIHALHESLRTSSNCPID